jgi:hypothetical protein
LPASTYTTKAYYTQCYGVEETPPFQRIIEIHSATALKKPAFPKNDRYTQCYGVEETCLSKE